MKRHISTAVLTAALLLSGVSAEALFSPAYAQDDGAIGFDTFHDQLASYGDWVYSDRWGEVWIPTQVPDDFQPYATNGYWAYTDDYGWTWVSNYEWGDIPFHYGRWVNDPDDGWLWIPGYVWSPAWVIWRSNGQYTGWMPMPPDPEFLGYANASAGISLGGGLNIGIDFGHTNDYYGYAQWYGPGYSESNFAANWVFVGTGHMGDRDFSRYQAPRGNYTTIIHNTTNITNYTVVNNYVVNKSVDVRVVEKAGGHQVQAVHLAQVIKHPQFIAHADAGVKVQAQMRTEMPRGNGVPNSAPKPSPKVVESLSTKVSPHAGHPAAHLYTRESVTKATLPATPGGKPIKPVTIPASNAPGNKANEAPAAEHEDHMHAPGGPAGTTPTMPSTEREDHMHAPPGAPAGTAPTTPSTEREDRLRETPNAATTGSAPSSPASGPPHAMMRRTPAEQTAPVAGPSQETSHPTMHRAMPDTSVPPTETRHIDRTNAAPPPPPPQQRMIRTAPPPTATPSTPVVHEKPATPPPPPEKKQKPDEPHT